MKVPSSHALYMRKWREKNKEKWVDYMRKWREDNKAHEKRYRKKRYLVIKDKLLADKKKWMAENKEIVSARNHDSYIKNRDSIIIKKHKKLLACIGEPSLLTTKKWNKIKKNQEFVCLMCGKKEPEITLTIDHIIPRNKWIEWRKAHPVKYKCDSMKNIQALCLKCNASKGAKIV